MASEIVTVNAIEILGEYNDVPIQVRPADQYVNATAICKATGRLWANYWGTGPARDFAACLSQSIAIAIDQLVLSRPGMPERGGGTWVHRHIAIHLAQWCSPAFAVWCTAKLDDLFLTGRSSIVKEHAEATITEILGQQTEILLGIAGTQKLLFESVQSHGGRIGRLEEQQSRVECALQHVLRRKDPPKHAKAKHLRVLLALGRMCPCCQLVPVVNDTGWQLPEAEWDHWFGNHLVGWEQIWLVCRKCNRSFTPSNRHSFDHFFRAWLGRVRNFDLAKQLTLGFEAA